MSHLRQVTKRHSHYLVRYECDKKLQVRTTGFFDTGEKVMVGKTYKVQWGLSKRDVATAVVLFAGSSEDCQTALKTTLEEDGKQKKRKATTTEKKKTVCRPLRLALPSLETGPSPTEGCDTSSSARTEESDTSTPNEGCNTSLSPSTDGSDTSTLVEEQPVPSASTSNDETEEVVISSPTTPGVFSFDGAPASPVTPRAFRPNGIGSMQQLLSTVNVLVNQNTQLISDNRKLHQCVERQSVLMTKMTGQIHELSKKVDTLSVKISEQNKDKASECSTSSAAIQDIITSEYALSDSEIHSIKADSNNAGHFASNLVRRLFPELFGIGNYRLQYNWYGGGKLGKNELCKERKLLVKQYVTRYYPEHRDESSFKDSIVPKVNELLRRKEKGKDKENNGTEAGPLDENTSFSSFLNYLNCP